MKSLRLLASVLLAASPSIPTSRINSEESLISSAREALHHNDTNSAYDFLAQAYAQNANAPGLMPCFVDFFKLKIRLEDDAVDRMGLASLLSDMGRYEEAAQEYQVVVREKNLPPPLREKATSMLFGTRAAICDWKTVGQDGAALVSSVRASLASNSVPAVHPFEALMYPCLSLEDSTRIAGMYAMRAMQTVGRVMSTATRPSKVENGALSPPSHEHHRIKVGYISPDFTSKHPLAFLMQDVFRFHNSTEFQIHIYSLFESDGSQEVEKIKDAADRWTVLSGTTQEAVDIIRGDQLDIVIDLCGYTGTALIAEVMASRVAPVQVGYMGFPASSGAPFIDYMVADEVVVPPSVPGIRQFYSENLILMPHSYFVNSHRFFAGGNEDDVEPIPTRTAYGLPEDGFVFCCHSRPDKIDPSTFRSWLRVLKKLRKEGGDPDAVIWLLRSGNEMESNLRRIAKDEFGLGDDTLVFTSKVPREQHLKRLRLADLFLDTPAYNAHTVGCDCLSAGVPMISLLRPAGYDGDNEVPTEKLASRVGASLLRAAGLDSMIASSMVEYESIMLKCATDRKWFGKITDHLERTGFDSPLFDTERWVRNLEAGLKEVATGKSGVDIYVVDNN